jgi:hypothetical protein
MGPCRVGEGGIQTCSRDVSTTWESLNLDGVVVTRSAFYHKKRQVHWWLATGAATKPNLKMVLQTDATHQSENFGIRGGWAKHTGDITSALCTCNFSDNIDDNTARSNDLKPFIGMQSGKILMCDTGTTDNGTAYSARIVSAPYILGAVLNKIGVMAGTLVATAAAGVSILVKALRDFELETKSTTISLTPTASETVVIKDIDNLSISSGKVVQIEFADEATPSGSWELHYFAFKPRTEDTA